jgi:hypothetical protein
MALKVHLQSCLPFRQLFVVETKLHVKKLPGALPNVPGKETIPGSTDG